MPIQLDPVKDKNKTEEETDTSGNIVPNVNANINKNLTKNISASSPKTSGEAIENIYVDGVFVRFDLIDTTTHESIVSETFSSRDFYSKKIVVKESMQSDTLIGYFSNEKGEKVGSKYIKPGGATTVTIRAVSPAQEERDSLLLKAKNRGKVEARLNQLASDPTLQGKLHLHMVKSGDNVFVLSKNTLALNNTNQNNYFTKLTSLNSGLFGGQIGECLIYLKDWTDPKIGKLPQKPSKDNLSLEMKEAIATIYGEQSMPGVQSALQRKYIWYGMVLRVGSPAYPAKLREVISASMQYQAYGGSNWKNAMDKLNSGKPDGVVAEIVNMVLAEWDKVPADASTQYFHWEAAHQKYYDEAKGTPEEREKAACLKYCEANKSIGFNTAALPKGQAWSKKISSESGALKGSMYLYPNQ